MIEVMNQILREHEASGAQYCVHRGGQGGVGSAGVTAGREGPQLQPRATQCCK